VYPQGVGVRARKQSLVLVVRAHCLAGKLTQIEADTFELMYRRCRTELEQDQVSKALHDVMDGWKTDRGSRLAHLRRIKERVLLPEEEEDEDPPALQAALARARVDVRR
jgi:hypothetical protein